MVAVQGLVRRFMRQGKRGGGAAGRGGRGAAPRRRAPAAGGRQGGQDAMIGRQVRKFLKR